MVQLTGWGAGEPGTEIMPQIMELEVFAFCLLSQSSESQTNSIWMNGFSFDPKTVWRSYLNNNNGTMQDLINDAVVLPSNRLCMREWLYAPVIRSMI